MNNATPQARAYRNTLLLALFVLLGTATPGALADQVPPRQGDWLDPELILPLGTIRHDRADSAYRGLGESSEYQSVGLLLGPGSLSSGTLIHSNFMLTAAHSVEGSLASQLTFMVGGQSYQGAQVFIHPDWTGDLLAGNDLAIVRLANPVLNVTPAILNTSTNELGQIGTYVGFGSTGTGLTGYINGTAGSKRAGTNVLDEFGDFFSNVSERIVLSDFDHPSNPSLNTFGSSVPLDLEYSVAPGDSGGGLFIDVGSGPVLTGVHSWIFGFDGTNNASYGDLMGSVRVSSHHAWIVSVIPEPSSYMLLTLGMIGLYTLRRRGAKI